MRRSGLGTRALLIGALLHGGSAGADEFQDHFDLATALNGEGRYLEALRELNIAYALRPVPLLLYNRAQVQRKLGRSHEALIDLEGYLREVVVLEPDMRTRVARQRAELSAKLAAEPVPAGEGPRPPPPPPPLWRRPWLWGVVGGVLGAGVAVGTGLGIYAWGRRGPAQVTDLTFSLRF